MAITIATNNISSSGTLTLNNQQLSTVAFTGNYDDLTNKPDSDGSVIVDSWRDGSEWYRVYRDGRIEQGGSLTNTNAADGITANTVTFVKSFTTTSYQFYRSTVWKNAAPASIEPYAHLASGCYNKQLTNVSFRNGGSSERPTTDWIAIGY